MTMLRITAGVLICAMGVASVVTTVGGCSGDPNDAESSSSGEAGVCTDVDNDGFGTGCVKGPDCDDNNPAVGNECYVCNGSAQAGCGCSTEGARAACGEVKSKVGDQVSCLFGQAECHNGVWGPCTGTNAATIHTLGLAATASACSLNPCDPYCQQFPDTPDNTLTVDGGIQGSEAGLTLPGNGGGVPWDAAIDGPINPAVQAYLTDAGQMPDSSYYYHELAPDASSPSDTLILNAQITYMDVYFLLDTSATMASALTNLGTAVAGPGGIIPTVRASFPNARFGVGHFHAYQIDLHDTTTGPFQAIPWIGAGNKAVFPLLHSINVQTDDTSAQNVMLWLGANGTTANNDKTEGAMVALYAAASQGGLWARTSAGLNYGTDFAGNWHNSMTGGGAQYWVNPRNAGSSQAWVTDYPGVAGGRPALAASVSTSGACPAGSVGYPCFGATSIPITIVMTDNAGTQGPGGIFAIEHNSADATYVAQYGLPGSLNWPNATTVNNNGTEATALTIDPTTFHRYRGDFSSIGAPVTGSLTADGETGFDLSNTALFPSVVPGDTILTDCVAGDGVGREAYFKFTVPAGNGMFVHFDTIGSEKDTVLYVIDQATRKRVACNDDVYDYANQPGKPGTIDAKLPPGNYTLVVDEKVASACPTNYTLGTNGRCYRRVTTNTTWTASETACIADGAHLASVATATGNAEDAVINLPAPGLFDLTGKDYNIGLKKSGATWVWTDGTPYVVGNARWDTGQPNATAGNDCVYRSKTTGKWTNVSCTAATRGYVCEQAPSGTNNYFLQVNAMADTAPVALPTFDQMVAAHNAIGGKIIGIDVSGVGPVNSTGTDFDKCTSANEDPTSAGGGQAFVDRFLFVSLQEAARRTGSINGTDANYWTNPYVFAMNGNAQACHVGDPSIGTQVVSALTSLTQTLRQDVSIQAFDSDDATDFDYAGAPGTPAQLTPNNLDEGPNVAIGRPLGVFIQSATVIPLLTGNGSHAPGPGGQPRCLDNVATPSVIEQCLPDTQVSFAIVFSTPPSITQLSNPQIFKFDVNVVGSGQGQLATAQAVIVVPPLPTSTFAAADFIRTYDTSSVCQTGSPPIWGHWSWTSATPSDSKIDFFVKTADTVANLATATEHPLLFTNPPGPVALAGTAIGAKTATSTSSGAAVVDTTLALSGEQRRNPILQVRSRLTPSTGNLAAPTLQSWNLEVSCVPSE